MGPVSWGLWVGHSWQSLFVIKGTCCPMGRPFNKSLGEQEVHLPTERLRWFWLGVSQLHVCLEFYQAHNFFSAKGPLSCSQSLPIHPWINLLADFWSSHLRNEFTWCYANPSISYSYISMNDYRSWARLIEFFPSSGNKAATLGFFISLCFLVSRESAASWSDMLPSDCRYLLSHVSILLYFIVIVLMRTMASCSPMKCFPNEQQTPWVSDQRKAKLRLNSGRDHGRRKEDGVRSQGNSRKGGVDRQW